jgi:hypothetical protein
MGWARPSCSVLRDLRFSSEPRKEIFFLLLFVLLDFGIPQLITSHPLLLAPVQSGKVWDFSLQFTGFIKIVLNQVRQTFGSIQSSIKAVLRWLARFDAWNPTTAECLDTLRKQFTLGLQDGRF